MFDKESRGGVGTVKGQDDEFEPFRGICLSVAEMRYQSHNLVEGHRMTGARRAA